MPAVVAVDMPGEPVAAGEPAADELLSFAGFDKPGQLINYMTEPQ
jgi:hypothetical protein